jgi:predicted MFS family arabinose efflux permease
VIGPTRLYFAARDHDDLGLMAALAAVTVLFAGTPFILDDVAADFGVTLGSAGLMSTAQVGAFGIATFVAGRRLRTSRRHLIWASVLTAAANVASAVAPSFELLLLTRVATGIGAGVLVWLSWAKGMRSAGGIRTMSAVGPLSALLAAPLLSTLAEIGGADLVFSTTAAVFALPPLLRATFTGYRPERRRMSPSRSNLVLVVAMGILTMSGNGLWVYAAVLGEQHVGLSPLFVSLGFSANALAGFLAARSRARPFPAYVWVLGIAVAAALVAFGGNPLSFGVGVMLWGYCFWMTTPALLSAISAWSLTPDERVGDAQSAMAAGRAIGPAIAGVLVGTGGSFTGVGIYAVSGLVASAAMVFAVSRHRATHEPPRGAVAA